MSERCKVRERLENLVQTLLLELGNLSSEQADLVRAGSQPGIDEVDKKLEYTFGQKERVLGALKQHRSDHGC
jgi:hypothetical protein